MKHKKEISGLKMTQRIVLSVAMVVWTSFGWASTKTFVPTASFTATTVCEGNPTVFTNTSTTLSGSIVSNIWDFGDGQSSSVLNPQHTFANSGNFSVKLTVINSDGDVATVTNLVTVHPAADVNFSISSTDQCESSLFTFTNLSNIVSGSITGYSWDFGDGNSSTTTSPTHTYAGHGSYTVIFTATTNQGCVDSFSEVLEVYPEPTVDFSFTNTCLGNSVQLTNNTQVASGNISYLWTFGDGNSSTQINPKHIYLAAGNYTISLQATTENGCVVSSNKPVDIHASPVASFTVSDVCYGTNVAFNNTSTISAGSNTYLWSFGDGNASTIENPTHDYAASGTYEVTLEVTSNQGCMESFNQFVNINPNPTASFSVGETCLGQAMNFVNNSSISSGSITYLWQFGDGNSSTDQDPSHTYATANTYNVTLTVTSDFVCPVVINEDVVVNPTSVGGDIVGATQLCEDDAANYALTLQNHTGEVVRWESSTTGLEPWSTINNITNTLAYSDLPETTHFRAVIKSGACDEVLSTEAVVTIDELSDGGMLEDLEVCTTSNSGILTLTNYVGDIVEWQQASDPLGTWTPIVNSTDQQSFSNLTNTTYYRALVQNGVCIAVTSAVSEVLVHPATVAGTLSSSATVCQGDNTGTISLSGYTGDIVRWENAPTIDGPWSVINHTLDNFDYTDLVQTTYFKAIVVSGNCDSEESNVVLIEVDEVTEAGNITGTDAVCFAVNTGDLTLENAVGQVIDWESSPNGFDTWTSISNTNTSITFTDLNVDTYYRVLVQNGGCTLVPTATFKVSVSPLPVLSYSNDEVCFGSMTTFTDASTITTGSITDYFWNLGNGVVSVSPNPTYTFLEPGVFPVKLKVTSSSGCVDSLTQSVVVNPKPEVYFDVSNACFGETISFNNTSNILFGNITDHNWTFGDGNSSTEVNPQHDYLLAGDYEITLGLTSDQGCASTSIQFVSVHPRAVPNFTVSNSCFGQETEFFNNTIISSGNVTYVWDFGDGNTSTEINPAYEYTEEGVYNAQLSVTTSEGCVDELIREISIFPQPLASFEIADNCLDSTFVFVNTSVFSGTGITYSWDFGDGTFSDQESPSHAYISAETYTVTLTTSGGNGCDDMFTKVLRVAPLPLTDFIFEEVCDSESVVFSNLSSISSGSISYEWDFGDGTTSAEVSPEHLYSTHGTYQVSLVATSDFGCQRVVEKAISIHPLPVVDFIAPPVCDANPVVFENLSSIPSGQVASYLWDFGDQTNAVVQHPTKEYLNKGTYEVKLTVTSDQGCQVLSIQEVVVQSVPIANFTIEDVCIGTAIEPTNESSISDGTLTYQWNLGDLNSSVATEPIHQYEEFGVYEITLVAISENGCADEITRPVIVHNPPLVKAGENATVSQGYAAQLIAEGGTNYSWEPVTGLSNSNAANPLASPLETTEYVVSVTDQFGCTSTDVVTVFVEADFKLVATNVLTPDGNGQNDAWVVDNVETFGEVNVRVYDRWGKTVYEQKAYQNDWSGTSGTDLLPDGTYYYYISFDNSDQEYRGALTIIRNTK